MRGWPQWAAGCPSMHLGAPLSLAPLSHRAAGTWPSSDVSATRYAPVPRGGACSEVSAGPPGTCQGLRTSRHSNALPFEDGGQLHVGLGEAGLRWRHRRPPPPDPRSGPSAGHSPSPGCARWLLRAALTRSCPPSRPSLCWAPGQGQPAVRAGCGRSLLASPGPRGLPGPGPSLWVTLLQSCRICREN